MNVGHRPLATKPPSNITILLMDTNSERRALRRKVLALHGVEVVGACDLLEASSIWHRDRYDMVLMDIRADHHGCLSWRDEIKKESPEQMVAFLVGGPKYVDVAPLANSMSLKNTVCGGEIPCAAQSARVATCYPNETVS